MNLYPNLEKKLNPWVTITYKYTHCLSINMNQWVKFAKINPSTSTQANFYWSWQKHHWCIFSWFLNVFLSFSKFRWHLFSLGVIFDMSSFSVCIDFFFIVIDTYSYFAFSINLNGCTFKFIITKIVLPCWNNWIIWKKNLSLCRDPARWKEGSRLWK